MTSWSGQQEQALVEIGEWIKDKHGAQVFRLFGFAGTGKTTLAKEIAQKVRKPRFGAFTGKAAYRRLRQKMDAGIEYQLKLNQAVHALMYGRATDPIARMMIAEDVNTAIRAHLEKVGDLVIEPSGGIRTMLNKFNGIPFETSKWLPPSILAVAFNKAGVIIGIIKKDEENVEAQGKE